MKISRLSLLTVFALAGCGHHNRSSFGDDSANSPDALGLVSQTPEDYCAMSWRYEREITYGYREVRYEESTTAKDGSVLKHLTGFRVVSNDATTIVLKVISDDIIADKALDKLNFITACNDSYQANKDHDALPLLYLNKNNVWVRNETIDVKAGSFDTRVMTTQTDPVPQKLEVNTSTGYKKTFTVDNKSLEIPLVVKSVEVSGKNWNLTRELVHFVE